MFDQYLSVVYAVLSLWSGSLEGDGSRGGMARRRNRVSKVASRRERRCSKLFIRVSKLAIRSFSLSRPEFICDPCRRMRPAMAAAASIIPISSGDMVKIYVLEWLLFFVSYPCIAFRQNWLRLREVHQ